jgi:hypothetical protein
MARTININSEFDLSEIPDEGGTLYVTYKNEIQQGPYYAHSLWCYCNFMYKKYNPSWGIKSFTFTTYYPDDYPDER